MEEILPTGLAWEEKTMWHDTGLYFGPKEVSCWIEPIVSPENVDCKRRIKNLLDATGLTEQLISLKVEPASDTDLLAVHSKNHLQYIKDTSSSGGGNVAKQFGTTRVGENGFEIAALGAGAAISCVKDVMSGDVNNAYALIRPPGHHADAEQSMGFCVFNNAAIAASFALRDHELERVAFVDWDVHHGNGTQSIFWNDDRVLTISIHQDNCFPPDSGSLSEVGGKKALGSCLNIPLPPGSNESVYLTAFERVILPALRKFKPDFIFVPCGFDAGFHDPLGRMMLRSESFRKLTKMIKEIAEELCEGRLVMTHEGGYSPHSVPFHALAVFEELSGIDTNIIDPYGNTGNCEVPKLLRHEEDVISAAENLLLYVPEG